MAHREHALACYCAKACDHVPLPASTILGRQSSGSTVMVWTCVTVPTLRRTTFTAGAPALAAGLAGLPAVRLASSISVLSVSATASAVGDLDN